jgi:hypothetical protein
MDLRIAEQYKSGLAILKQKFGLLAHHARRPGVIVPVKQQQLHACGAAGEQTKIGTAERGLSGGRSPHRASVSRTPGKSVHSVVMFGKTCIMVSCDLAMSAALRACANATSLAAEKSEACRMLPMIGTLYSWCALIVGLPTVWPPWPQRLTTILTICWPAGWPADGLGSCLSRRRWTKISRSEFPILDCLYLKWASIWAEHDPHRSPDRDHFDLRGKWRCHRSHGTPY